jgi:type IV secretory pathway TrbD component
MSANTSRNLFIGALVLLVIAAGYAAIVGAALQVVTLLAPLFGLLLLAFLAIRLWTRSRAHH